MRSVDDGHCDHHICNDCTGAQGIILRLYFSTMTAIVIRAKETGRHSLERNGVEFVTFEK